MTPLFVLGTRPEAIKMAPVIMAARRRAGVRPIVCSTGQHREMLAQALGIFGIEPDIELSIMRPGQGVNAVLSRAVERLDAVIARHKPDCLYVQGDTTTALAGAMAGYFSHVPVGHIEAGLRSGDHRNPWPEENNRRLITVVASRHYAPTAGARDNLLAEGVLREDVLTTGNTVIDALHAIRDRIAASDAMQARLTRRFSFLDDGRRVILVTGHRRESFGEDFRNIFRALARIAEREDVNIVYPVHLNPNVREPARRMLRGRDNVHLLEPLDYVSFIHLLQRAHIVLTDSGGIQEEAPAFGKPVLVMRKTSERMEAVHAGVARLVHADTRRIVAAVNELLDDAEAHAAMSRAVSPFGDGRAAGRIIDDMERLAGVVASAQLV